MNISELHKNIFYCKRCHLVNFMSDHPPVPGNGNPNADLMLCGEALGETEMIAGIPFVGAAGQLLNKMLKQAGLVRDELYITNVVKCRPTKENKGYSNRPPTDDEIQACKGWLWKEIQLVDPKIIVTLGKVATYTLLNDQLNKTFSIGKIIGKPHTVSYHKAKIIPLYHPSYLMQHGQHQINSTIEYLKRIKNELF